MSTSSPTLLDLQDRLDSLWTTHLNHLNTYTLAQETLQKHLSAGFYSLARANFNTRDSVKRCGRDYYHERPIASKRAAISSESGGGAVTIKFAPWEAPSEDDDNNTESSKDEPRQQPSPPSTPEPEPIEPVESKDETLTSKATESASSAKQPLAATPLRWFGILIPRELRMAQASFNTAVDDGVADAVNAARRMREVEVEIRKLRKEIRRAEKAGEKSKGAEEVVF